MLMSISVLVADDHGVIRDGLRLLINSQPDLRVVAEVNDAALVAPAVEEARPDVVLLDLSMPGGGGFRALADLKRAKSRARVLVVTMHDNSSYLEKSLEAGAAGYVVKEAASDLLLDAIRQVNAGQQVIHGPPSLGRTTPEEPLESTGMRLSRREREVLQFIANGHTNREAADQLNLSIKTVEGYRARLVRKIGARNRVDLVRFAMREGLIDG